MRPALAPGDRLLVVRGRRPRPGDVVAVDDPRRAGRVLVKRVVAVHPGGELTVAGDNPGASTDSRTFGCVTSLRGRAVYRYAPSHRMGRVR